MSQIVYLKKNIEKDARNWWEACNQISYGYDFSKRVPEKIRKRVKGSRWADVRKYLKLIIKKKYYSKEHFNFLKNRFLPYWNKKEKVIIKKLNKIHKNKFPVKFVNIYYTSCPRSPYGKEGEGFWIQLNELNKNKNILLRILVHELMHLYFFKYYKSICLKKGLKYSEIEDIKESFTVLINEEFKGIIKVKDWGYESHKELRKFILQEWAKSKDFKRVLFSIIGFVKKD